MRNKKILLLIAIIAVAVCLAAALTGCLPQDSIKLIDKAQSIWNKSSEKSVADVAELEQISIEVPNSRVSKLKIVFRDGNISMKRSVKGKNAYIEVRASSIIMEAYSGDATTSLTFLGINTNAFMNVNFLFRLRLTDNKLSVYYSIDNLKEVMETLPEKTEKTLIDEEVDANTANIVRTMTAQSLLGNPRTDGVVDAKNYKYDYTMSDNARINNELFRIPKLLISAAEFGDWNLADSLDNLFGQSDVEEIANTRIVYEPLTVANKFSAAKGGYYITNKYGFIDAVLTLEPSVINKILTKFDISLSADKDTVCKIKIKINSDYSLKANI